MRIITILWTFFMLLGCSSAPQDHKAGESFRVPRQHIFSQSQHASQQVWVQIQSQRPGNVVFWLSGSVQWSYLQTDDGKLLIDMSIQWVPIKIFSVAPEIRVEDSGDGTVWDYKHVNEYGDTVQVSILASYKDGRLIIDPFVNRLVLRGESRGTFMLDPIVIDIDNHEANIDIPFSGVLFCEEDNVWKARSVGAHGSLVTIDDGAE